MGSQAEIKEFEWPWEVVTSLQVNLGRAPALSPGPQRAQAGTRQGSQLLQEHAVPSFSGMIPSVLGGRLAGEVGYGNRAWNPSSSVGATGLQLSDFHRQGGI